MDHDRAYFLFDNIIHTLVDNYTHNFNEFYINEVVIAVKNIYIDKKLFKYIMEQYYSDSRNPFTTAYSQFMNKINQTPLDELFYDISRDILYRLIRENRADNDYIVF